MNAELLLAHYERIAEAPDAITRLRRFILELAVQGRLVRSDAAPRNGMLGQAGEWAGGNGFPKQFQGKAEGEIAFLKVSDMNLPGNERDITTANNFVSADDLRSMRAKAHPAGTIIFPKIGGAIATNKRRVLRLRAAIDNNCAGQIPNDGIDVDWLFMVLSSIDMSAYQAGTAVPALNMKRLAEHPVAFPTEVEQRRIVAKVDELMALCDQLEAARAKREMDRDKLTLSTLSKLNEPDPESFVDDARFALEHLEPLTKRTDQIKQLRQTILNLAVRGKLVEQDPNDEPASELLHGIMAVKAKTKLKGEPSAVSHEEAPYQLPQRWVWSRIGDICTKTGSGSTPRGGKDVYKTSGIPFLRSQNIYNDGLRLNDVAFIDPQTHARMGSTGVEGADLLLNITGGSMGRCCRIPNDFSEANISQHVAIIRPALLEMSDFLHLLVLSPYFQAFVFDEQTGAGRGGLPKNRMDRIVVALPPLAEQHRIVAKVDELMALCDQLESNLGEGEKTRSKLLEAVLHEALEPA